MKKSNIFTLGLLVLTICITFSSILAQPVKIALIPFAIPEDTTLTQLRDGIYDLLSARLSSATDSVIIINRDSTDKACEETKNFTGEAGALMVGSKLQADLVVQGALSTIDSLIKVDAQIIDVSSKKEPLTISKNVTGLDRVIPYINRFATDIIDSFFKGESKTEEKGKEQPDTVISDTAIVPQVAEKEEVKTDTTEKKAAINPAFIKADTTVKSDQDFWKSEIYPILINGLAIADIDKDGKNELFVLTPKMLQTYRCENGKLEKIADIQKIKFRYPISIDIADINGNGFPEIFITALDSYQKGLSSLVLEYKGIGYTTISKNLHYYLRVVQKKDNTPLLLGQRHIRNNPYKGVISEMKWNEEEGKYLPEKKFISSKDVSINLIGLAYGDISQKNQPLIVAYDKNSTVTIINSKGEIIGKSKEELGGSTFYYKIEEGFASEGANIYLPMRIRVHDIDADGKAEIIAVKNYDVTRNIFGKVRIYNKCHIEVLKWDGMALKTSWKTGILPEFIRDFVIGDFDNDGKDELVAALVHREGKFILSKPKCSFIVLELE